MCGINVESTLGVLRIFYVEIICCPNVVSTWSKLTFNPLVAPVLIRRWKFSRLILTLSQWWIDFGFLTFNLSVYPLLAKCWHFHHSIPRFVRCWIDVHFLTFIPSVHRGLGRRCHSRRSIPTLSLCWVEVCIPDVKSQCGASIPFFKHFQLLSLMFTQR